MAEIEGNVDELLGLELLHLLHLEATVFQELRIRRK
jgi:hypothetical protein